ncbi:hypothetical protein TanjilG_10591 [Lupinus angustifolius]|uniref:Uncharacterized protein n=1 Tax=Lupinus angustifolius TaxID=3871 RepID=A0A4P1RVZ9_LUPAN|nr:hypothetical protein TanjilG_10591 [Lupinus angustifolius]
MGFCARIGFSGTSVEGHFLVVGADEELLQKEGLLSHFHDAEGLLSHFHDAELLLQMEGLLSQFGVTEELLQLVTVGVELVCDVVVKFNDSVQGSASDDSTQVGFSVNTS